MGPMSAAASWRREKEAITYQSSVVSCRLFRGQLLASTATCTSHTFIHTYNVVHTINGRTLQR
jgi:hypothetical protein